MKIMVYVLVIITTFFFNASLGFTQSIESIDLESKYHFKNYFGYDKLQTVTSEEEDKIVKYAISLGLIEHAIMKNGDTAIANLYYLLPRVRGIHNSPWLDSFSTRGSELDYKGVDYRTIYSIIRADAFIQGKVVDVRYVSQELWDKCYNFKTEFVVEVIEVVHSYMDISVGDFVLVCEEQGYTGGCGVNPQPKPVVFEQMSHRKFYGIGDTSYFALEHHITYQNFFYFKEYKLKKYDEQKFKLSYYLGAIMIAKENPSIVDESI
ncbi:MAG: hypothetical protein JKY53_06790, partial [Flavobacteriales bacterium]|nr:hypothetical protein [Flavobacteriales bacterium]